MIKDPSKSILLSLSHCLCILDLSHFPDKYDSERVESGWYEWWKSRGHFREELNNCGNGVNKDNGGFNGKPGRFTLLLPPPNVTGTLHLGHALTVAIQVILH